MHSTFWPMISIRRWVLASLWGSVLWGADPVATADAAPADVRRITLTEALRLAHTQGRDKLVQNEELELLKLGLERTRGDYGPIFSSTLASELYGTGSRQNPGNRQSADLGVRQSLPGGGTVTANTGVNRTGPPGDGAASSGTTASVNVTQPILKGAGLAAWREPLTAAERAFRYGLRAHRRYVQQLSLDIAKRFWSLQDRQFAVEQDRKALVQAEWSVGLAKANLDLGKARATALDVFRAETQLIQTSQRLVDNQAAFAAELDGLKIDLALPVDQPISIDDGRPLATVVEVDATKVIATALAERSDLATTKDNVDDADRRLATARRNLLPQLDATAGSTWNGTFDGTSGDSYGQAPAWSAGLRLTVPLDQHNEDYSYESTLISRRQVARNAELKRSRVIQEVQAALQALRSAEATLAIQERNRSQARVKVEKTLLDLQAGEVGNRDVVESQNELTIAENAWFQAQAAYRAAELALRNAAGVLIVQADGAWAETPPDYATIKPKPQPKQAP